MSDRRADDTPALVVDPRELVALDTSPGTMRAIPGSRMFEIRDALDEFRRHRPADEIFDASQGDGGASLPGVSDELLDAAHTLQKEHGTGYDKAFGTELFRRAVVEEYWSLDSETGWGPPNVIACQGGRDALLKAYDAAVALGHGRRGDFVVTSRVPWLSYNWGPYAVGANVMLAPGREEDGWAITPAALDSCHSRARSMDGRRIAMLVITSPDNPTGRTMTLEQQLELTRSALDLGIPFVLLDWIYHRVTDREAHDLNQFLLGLEPFERERCIILDGITKSLGASNVRNAHLVASTSVIRHIQARASHGVIPSFHSQAVAVAAYRMGFDRASADIVGPTSRSREVLRRFLHEHELRFILGQGYYAFIDTGPWLDECGFVDSARLGSVLAERHGLAVVPGVYFSRYGGRWIRFSYALEPATTLAAARRLWEGLQGLDETCTTGVD